MAIPEDDLTTQHLDSATDDPSQARVELLATIQTLKALLAALDTAATARLVQDGGTVPEVDQPADFSELREDGVRVLTEDFEEIVVVELGGEFVASRDEVTITRTGSTVTINGETAGQSWPSGNPSTTTLSDDGVIPPDMRTTRGYIGNLYFVQVAGISICFTGSTGQIGMRQYDMETQLSRDVYIGFNRPMNLTYSTAE